MCAKRLVLLAPSVGTTVRVAGELRDREGRPWKSDGGPSVDTPIIEPCPVEEKLETDKKPTVRWRIGFYHGHGSVQRSDDRYGCWIFPTLDCQTFQPWPIYVEQIDSLGSDMNGAWLVARADGERRILIWRLTDVANTDEALLKATRMVVCPLLEQLGMGRQPSHRVELEESMPKLNGWLLRLPSWHRPSHVLLSLRVGSTRNQVADIGANVASMVYDGLSQSYDGMLGRTKSRAAKFRDPVTPMVLNTSDGRDRWPKCYGGR